MMTNLPKLEKLQSRFNVFFVLFLLSIPLELSSCKVRTAGNELASDPSTEGLEVYKAQILNALLAAEHIKDNLTEALIKNKASGVMLSSTDLTVAIARLKIENKSLKQATERFQELFYRPIFLSHDLVDDKEALFGNVLGPNHSFPRGIPIFGVRISARPDGSFNVELGNGIEDFLLDRPLRDLSIVLNERAMNGDPTFQGSASDFRASHVEMSGVFQGILLSTYGLKGFNITRAEFLRGIQSSFETGLENHEKSFVNLAKQVGSYEIFYKIATGIGITSYEDDETGKVKRLPVPLSLTRFDSRMTDPAFVKTVNGRPLQINGMKNPFLALTGKALEELPVELKKKFRVRADGGFVFYHRTRSLEQRDVILSGNAFSSIGNESAFGGAASWGEGFYVAPSLDLTRYGIYVINTVVSPKAVIGRDLDFFVGAQDGLIVVVKDGSSVSLEIESDRAFALQEARSAMEAKRFELAIQLLQTVEDFKVHELTKGRIEKLHPLIQLYIFLRENAKSQRSVKKIDRVILDYFGAVEARPEFLSTNESLAISTITDHKAPSLDIKVLTELNYFKRMNTVHQIKTELSQLLIRIDYVLDSLLEFERENYGQRLLADRVKYTRAKINALSRALLKALQSSDLKFGQKFDLLVSTIQYFNKISLHATIGMIQSEEVVSDISKMFSDLDQAFLALVDAGKSSDKFWLEVAEFENMKMVGKGNTDMLSVTKIHSALQRKSPQLAKPLSDLNSSLGFLTGANAGLRLLFAASKNDKHALDDLRNFVFFHLSLQVAKSTEGSDSLIARLTQAQMPAAERAVHFLKEVGGLSEPERILKTDTEADIYRKTLEQPPCDALQKIINRQMRIPSQ